MLRGISAFEMEMRPKIQPASPLVAGLCNGEPLRALTLLFHNSLRHVSMAPSWVSHSLPSHPNLYIYIYISTHIHGLAPLLRNPPPSRRWGKGNNFSDVKSIALLQGKGEGKNERGGGGSWKEYERYGRTGDRDKEIFRREE